MMKSAEKVSKPTASFSFNQKQMQKSRFGPRSFEPTESEHEAPANRGTPCFSYNLMNIPAYPPVQYKETDDEEELLQGKMIETAQRQPEEEEEEKLQAKSMSGSLIPNVQRQTDPDAEDEEVLQGKFLPVQRKLPHFSYNLVNIPVYPPVQCKEPEDEVEIQGKSMGKSITPKEQKQAEPKPNLTGMPDQLKAGIESLSGIDMSDVRVHANSDKPARLNALAYTQGNEIHLGHGQEKHLPHEAWHVVQQAHGRVQAITQIKKRAVNDDPSLEHEADVMGVKAAQFIPAPEKEPLQEEFGEGEVQKAKKAPNNKELSGNLKAGIEILSRRCMDWVKVHYNSGKPMPLNVLAYAHGTDIHVGPGQERHLPHEAWHVMQQGRGNENTNTQLRGVRETQLQPIMNVSSHATYGAPGVSQLQKRWTVAEVKDIFDPERRKKKDVTIKAQGIFTYRHKLTEILIRKVVSALENAEELVLGAMIQLNDKNKVLNGEAEVSFRYCFGPDDVNLRRAVFENYRRVLHGLNGDGLVIEDLQTTSQILGHSVGYVPNPGLGAFLWGRNIHVDIGMEGAAMTWTMIHEASHKFANTIDQSYLSDRYRQALDAVKEDRETAEMLAHSGISGGQRQQPLAERLRSAGRAGEKGTTGETPTQINADSYSLFAFRLAGKNVPKIP